MIQPMPDVRWTQAQGVERDATRMPHTPQAQQGGCPSPMGGAVPSVRTVTSGQVQSAPSGQTERPKEASLPSGLPIQGSPRPKTVHSKEEGACPKEFSIGDAQAVRPPGEQGGVQEEAFLLEELMGRLPPLEPAPLTSSDKDDGHRDRVRPDNPHEDSSPASLPRCDKPRQGEAWQGEFCPACSPQTPPDADSLRQDLPPYRAPDSGKDDAGGLCNGEPPKPHRQERIRVAGMSLSGEDLLLLMLMWVLWREKADRKLLLALLYVWLGA